METQSTFLSTLHSCLVGRCTEKGLRVQDTWGWAPDVSPEGIQCGAFRVVPMARGSVPICCTRDGGATIVTVAQGSTMQRRTVLPQKAVHEGCQRLQFMNRPVCITP